MPNKTLLLFQHKGDYDSVDATKPDNNPIGDRPVDATCSLTDSQDKDISCTLTAKPNIALLSTDSVVVTEVMPDPDLYSNRYFFVTADILEVNPDVSFALFTQNRTDDAIELIVHNQGRVELQERSKVKITDNKTSWIISTSKKQYSQITDTNKLISMANKIPEISAEIKDFNTVDLSRYSIYRQIKDMYSFKVVNTEYKKHPLKDFISDQLINDIDKNIFSLFGIVHKLQDSSIHDLTPDIIGHIGSYIAAEDIIL